MLVLADTNILLRRIHRAHPDHRLTRDAITYINERGDVFCVMAQNLVECWAACTSPFDNNGLSLFIDQATKVLSRIESSVERLSDADAVYAEWRNLVATYRLSGEHSHVARLVAAMKIHGLTPILVT